jgi:hypothetical protein
MKMNLCSKCILVAAAISISAVACSSSEPDDANTALKDQSVVHKLRDMGLETASISGEPSPTTMRIHWFSDHQKAVEAALGGSIVYDHSPVYVIVMTGGPFTSGHAPAGAPDPEGHVLTIIVNAATYEVTDLGIGDVEPDLSEIASASVDLSTN